MKTGLDNYDYGIKRNWRRWAWNQLNPELDGVVLYLCGPDDYDREIALKKGFKNHNLIAIDINKKNINNVRKNGGIGICGEIGNIIHHWNSRPKITGIIADLCCGLTANVSPIYMSIMESKGFDENCRIVINFLRGREHGLAIDAVSWAKDMFVCDTKHRGILFLIIFFTIFIDKIEKRNLLIKKNIATLFVHIMQKELNKIELIKMLEYLFLPKFYSYKSINKYQYFDSIAFSPKIAIIDHNNFKLILNKKTSQKITALKAVRTMMQRSHNDTHVHHFTVN